MKIENLKRAEQIVGELKSLDRQIANARQLSENGSGFVVSENRDGSGIRVEYLYKEGNYLTEIYQDVSDFIVKRLEQYKVELLAEIESL